MLQYAKKWLIDKYFTKILTDDLEEKEQKRILDDYSWQDRKEELKKVDTSQPCYNYVFFFGDYLIPWPFLDIFNLEMKDKLLNRVATMILNAPKVMNVVDPILIEMQREVKEDIFRYLLN